MRFSFYFNLELAVVLGVKGIVTLFMVAFADVLRYPSLEIFYNFRLAPNLATVDGLLAALVRSFSIDTSAPVS